MRIEIKSVLSTICENNQGSAADGVAFPAHFVLIAPAHMHTHPVCSADLTHMLRLFLALSLLASCAAFVASPQLLRPAATQRAGVAPTALLDPATIQLLAEIVDADGERAYGAVEAPLWVVPVFAILSIGTALLPMCAAPVPHSATRPLGRLRARPCRCSLCAPPIPQPAEAWRGGLLPPARRRGQDQRSVWQGPRQVSVSALLSRGLHDVTQRSHGPCAMVGRWVSQTEEMSPCLPRMCVSSVLQ